MHLHAYVGAVVETGISETADELPRGREFSPVPAAGELFEGVDDSGKSIVRLARCQELAAGLL